MNGEPPAKTAFARRRSSAELAVPSVIVNPPENLLGRGAGRSAAPQLELVRRTRPVPTQQTGERAVGEQPSAGLAGWTVVRLVLGEHLALHRGAADGAWP